ncbi:transcriptional regulator [Natrinema zhouii]|uniref:Transcriptional regulator n=1 Tax=Natrinema zhouii TaxID=1710539 RepID=A0A7D6GJY0_9EURY|nr:transcriptional regulator [Natrinema zhouii]QLK25580.1 transcriptional regulator [Natrinema zhouii]
MDSRTQERVEEWDSRPFNGGFDGLSDLAAGDFSGAVSAAGTWLFMLNGRIVGVIDGDIEDFDNASGTQYEAPHPSLPLLYTMEERGGEARAKYYTKETPLREVDSTLQSGSFTGYVELSENVLSGDYYAVYYGGRRMAAAYIGNAERLLTGDEAFERAADEVGIYTVTDVEIDIIDVPGTGDEPDSGSATESTTDSEPSDPAVGVGAADSTSDSTADATSHSIDPIDISSTDAVDTDDATGSDSIEDSTVDDEPSVSSEVDLTADPTGITTTDESEAKQESTTAGITESGPSVDRESDPRPDETDADDERELSEQDATTELESTEYVDPDAAPVEPTAPETEAESEAESASEPTPAEPGVEASPANESASSPDLAEVEAAAEELEQNDISWVDEDDGVDEDEDDDEVTGNGDDETTAVESSSDESPAEAEEASEDDGLEEQFEREEEWRETRRIPSIDPKNSKAAVNASAGARETKSDRSSTEQSSPSADASSADTPSSDARADTRSSEGAEPPTETSTAATATAAASDSRRDGSQDAESGSAAGAAADATDAQSERVAALTEKLETLQEQRDALVTKANELEAERDRLRSENEELSGTVERLQSRIAALETELERARERGADDAGAGGAGASAGTQLSPQQALSGTNLFVRYGSKSQPTLETAHDGTVDRDEVASNLRLEHHTGFDSSDAIVDGVPYEEFLTSTMEHRFVTWLTEILLYEIRDTGNADGLGDLYDAIPRIDRAELDATISLADDETEDVPDQVTFDLVAFDKMGNPLVLVTLNDSREPATQELLGELEEAASAVKANYPDLAAAIAVTSSYFEPGALEVAEQATSGGFLSRGSKLSYVNLSRKDGYHLCLVESRSEGFHMNVPEL